MKKVVRELDQQTKKEVELHSDMWYGVEVSIDSLAKDGSKSCVVIGRDVDRYVLEFLTQCT